MGRLRFQSEYRFVRVLGHGGAGVVELWQQQEVDQQVVVKRIDVDEGDTDTSSPCHEMEEARFLRRLAHPHIVVCLEFWLDKKANELAIVQEHCAGGDLQHAVQLARSQSQSLPEVQVLRWIGQ